MAVEKARAAGMQVEMVVVSDDTGVTRSQGGKVGRRGIAGTVLVHKVAGAMAASGASLSEVKRVAQLAADSIVSIGSSLSHVHVPGREVTEDELAIGETEIGMGIHNESGAEKVKSDLHDTVQRMLKHLLDQSDEDRAFLNISNKDDTVLLINNLGGVSPLEMGGITHEVVTQLKEKHSLKPKRVLAGSFMTSLNGLGFSVTLLKLTDKTLLELLEAPSQSTIWPHAINPEAWGQESTASAATKSADAQAFEASNLERKSTFPQPRHVLTHLSRPPTRHKNTRLRPPPPHQSRARNHTLRHTGRRRRLRHRPRSRRRNRSPRCERHRHKRRRSLPRQDHLRRRNKHGRHVWRAFCHLPQCSSRWATCAESTFSTAD